MDFFENVNRQGQAIMSSFIISVVRAQVSTSLEHKKILGHAAENPLGGFLRRLIEDDIGPPHNAILVLDDENPPLSRIFIKITHVSFDSSTH